MLNINIMCIYISHLVRARMMHVHSVQGRAYVHIWLCHVSIDSVFADVAHLFSCFWDCNLLDI